MGTKFKRGNITIYEVLLNIFTINLLTREEPIKNTSKYIWELMKEDMLKNGASKKQIEEEQAKTPWGKKVKKEKPHVY